LETAKECVTTHLPDEVALKMDVAQAFFTYTLPTCGRLIVCRVGGRGGLVWKL